MTHRIFYTVRQCPHAELPTMPDGEGGRRPATIDELAGHFGMQFLHDDLYSCVELYYRDDDAFLATGVEKWEGRSHHDVPGALVVQGPDRYRRLPPDVRDKVLQARVIRPSAIASESTAIGVAQANLAEQMAAIEEHVGAVDGAPLIDVTTPEAELEEARRLSAIADSGLEIATIPMALVDDETHLIEEQHLEPHRWSGERRF